MRKAARGVVGALGIGIAAAVGCASSPPAGRSGDGHLAAGEFAAAAVAYDEAVGRHPELLENDPELVERLALALAVPGHERSDAARARELLTRLVGDRDLRGAARAVLALLDELDRLTGALETLENESAVDAESLRRCTAEEAACDDLLDEERRRREELEAGARTFEERLRALEDERDELRARVEKLSEDLEAIKRIDLGRRP